LFRKAPNSKLQIPNKPHTNFNLLHVGSLKKVKDIILDIKDNLGLVSG